MLTPLSWIAISCFIIGLIIFVMMQIFVEFTVKGKVRFIQGISVWGVLCIFLTVWAFQSY